MEKNKVAVKGDLKGLKKFIKSLGELNGLTVKVGVLKGHNARNDKQTNAGVGLVHEFGSFTKHIPERSFLKMPLTTHQQEVIKAAKAGIEHNLVEGTVREKMVQIGTAAEKVVDDAFDSGGFGMWQPISKATEDRKNSAAILIDSGELRKSISSEVTKRGVQ